MPSWLLSWLKRMQSAIDKTTRHQESLRDHFQLLSRRGQFSGDSGPLWSSFERARSRFTTRDMNQLSKSNRKTSDILRKREVYCLLPTQSNNHNWSPHSVSPKSYLALNKIHRFLMTSSWFLQVQICFHGISTKARPAYFNKRAALLFQVTPKRK